MGTDWKINNNGNFKDLLNSFQLKCIQNYMYQIMSTLLQNNLTVLLYKLKLQ